MNKRTKIILAASAGIVLLGAASGAVAHRSEKHDGMRGERDQRGEMMFKKLDRDKDGKVTKAETEAFQDQKLAEFDADESGELNQAEYVAMAQAFMADHIKRRFERQDADKNGGLNLTEMSGLIMHMFDLLDANSDGAVDREERDKHGGHGIGHGDAGKS